MNILHLTILGIFVQTMVVLSRKEITPVEEDDEKRLDDVPRTNKFARRKDDREDVRPNDKDSLPEESQNVEATPAIVNGPNLPDNVDEQTKIPMSCARDYIGYCQTKFEGFQFKDGCHICRCIKKKFLCDKGPCQFFAHSFEHAATYCSDLKAQNDKDFKDQAKNRVDSGSKKLFPEISVLKSKISGNEIKVERALTNQNSDMIAGISNDTDKHLSEKSKISIERNQITRNSNGESDMTITDDKSKKVKNTKGKDVKVKNIKTEGNRIKDKINPVKSSLKKMSDKRILRHIIFYIAQNELNIKKIRKSMIRHVKNKETRAFLKRLKFIHYKNTKFKLKILEIVKIKLKLSKSNNGPFHNKFDLRYLRRIKRDLRRFGEELHEMKGGVKLWTTLSKTLPHSNAKSDGSYSSRISCVVIFISMVTVGMFHGNNKS